MTRWSFVDVFKRWKLEKSTSLNGWDILTPEVQDFLGGPEANKKCSQLLCQKCKCFKRSIDGDSEDLRLSTQFQEYIDNLSSSEEESEESDLDFNPDFFDDYFSSEVTDDTMF